MVCPRAFLFMATVLCAVSPAAQAQRGHQPSLEELEQRAVTDSNDAEVHYQLGMAYWKKERWDDAERSLRQAVALAPQYPEANLALSVLPDMRGDRYWKRVREDRGDEAVRQVFDEGRRLYRLAFFTDPLVDLSILPRAEERVSINIDGMNYFVWWALPLFKGINRLRTGKLEDALKQFQKIIDDERSGPQSQFAPDAAYWYHALTAARLSRYGVAVEDFWTLVQRSAEEEQKDRLQVIPLYTNHYRYMLATMLYLDGRYDQALPVFRRAVEFDAGLYQAHIQMARMYESARQWDDAVREREAAINANPDDPSLIVDLGATLARAGRLDQAEVRLQEAARNAPRDARALYLLGEVEVLRRDSSAARTAYRRFLGVAPSRYQALIDDVHGKLQEMEH